MPVKTYMMQNYDLFSSELLPIYFALGNNFIRDGVMDAGLIDLGVLLEGRIKTGLFFIVAGTPFLYVKPLKMLVMADLHLGYEEALARGYMYMAGKRDNIIRYVGAVIVPRRQLKRLMEHLDYAFGALGSEVERVLINGDLKHAFDRLLRQERIEIRRLLDYLYKRRLEVILVRGNHDNYLPLVLKDYGLELIRSYETMVNGVGRILFTHGHFEANINGFDLVVIGHEHPAARCLSTSKTGAFLLLDSVTGGQVLVLPAAGAYQAGTIISPDLQGYLSPIIRKHAVMNNAGVVTWVVDRRGPGDIPVGYMEGLEGVVSSQTTCIGEECYLYLGFLSMEDYMFICRL